MKRAYNRIRFSIILVILVVWNTSAFSQDFRGVSVSVNKDTGVETKGAIINSKDFYSLLVQKKLEIVTKRIQMIRRTIFSF